MKTSELKMLLSRDAPTDNEVQLTEADRNYVMDLETDLETSKNFINEFIDLLETVLKKDTAEEKLYSAGMLGRNCRIDILHTIATAQEFLSQWEPINERDPAVLYAD